MENISNLAILCDDSIKYSFKESTAFKEITEIHYEIFKNHSIEGNINRVSKLVQNLILSFDIFDDIQDKDKYHAPWSVDERQAINLGLYLLVSAYKEFNECRFVNKDIAFEYINLNLMNSIKGQYADIHNGFKTESEYIDMCRAKSGSLVSLAAILGALSTNSNSLLEIHSYALDIGIAAQISNDIRDLINFEKKNDLLEKKISLPIIYLLHDDQNASLISEYFSGTLDFNEIKKNKKEVIGIFYKSGALNYAKQVKEKYKNKAKNKVNNLPIHNDKKSIVTEKLIDII